MRVAGKGLFISLKWRRSRWKATLVTLERALAYIAYADRSVCRSAIDLAEVGRAGHRELATGAEPDTPTVRVVAGWGM